MTRPASTAPTSSPRPSGTAWKGVATLVASAAAGACGFLLMSRVAGDARLLREVRPLELLLALPVLLWLVLLAHELGHVLAARLCGWRFLLLLVGPLRVVRASDGLDVGLNRAWPTWGGLAASVPLTDGRFRRDMMAVVLGGPLASLLLAGAALLLAQGSGRTAAYGFVVALPSLLVGLITLVPMRTGGFASDGMQALELLRGGEGPARRARRVRLMTHGLAGGRPRDLDPRDIALAVAEADTPTDTVAMWQIAHHAALDRGALDEATEAAREIAARYQDFPDGMRQMLTLNLAWFAARHLRDADAARQWLARSKGGFVEPYQRPLADAGLAWLDGRLAQAHTSIADARAALRRAMDPGAAQFVADQLDALERDLLDVPSGRRVSDA